MTVLAPSQEMSSSSYLDDQHPVSKSHDTASCSSSNDSSSSSSSNGDDDNTPSYPAYYDDHDTYDDFDTSLHGLQEDIRQPSRRILTEDIVRAFLVDYYEDFSTTAPLKIRECWKAFYSKHYKKEYIFVRPSGNIVNQEEFTHMFMDDDLKVERMNMISIDSIQLLAENTVAVAMYTVEQWFRYKGTKNADQAMYTVVIELIEETGEPKIVQEHRSTGQPILTEETRWSSSSGGSGSGR